MIFDDRDGTENGGLLDKKNRVEILETSDISTNSKYEFVSYQEGMAGFIAEPRILKFTICEAYVDEEKLMNSESKDFRAEEFDSEKGWDFFDLRSLIVETDTKSSKLIDDPDDEDDICFGFSTEEEEDFDRNGLESVAETVSSEEELISEIDGSDDLMRTPELETGETEDTEETEESVSGFVSNEESSAGRLSVQRDEEAESQKESFVSTEIDDDKIEIPPHVNFQFVFPYRTRSDPEIPHEEDDDDEEEFIEIEPGKHNSDRPAEEIDPVEEPVIEMGFDSSCDEDEKDALWEHCEIVEQLKMELRQARGGGLPTIPEEESEVEEPVDSPKVVLELKPLKIDEKVGYKDLADSIQKVYRNYSDRMKKLDILNFQTMHAAGLLQLKDAVLLSRGSKRTSIPAMVLQNMFKLGKSSVEPMRKIVVEMQRDFEVIYVGQLCLSWEILHWQFWKSQELMNFDHQCSNHRYNQVAGEFQLFQVLLQRFVENEPFQGRPRVYNYVQDRCVVRNLLQVPMLKDDCLKDKEKGEGDYELVITSEILGDIMDQSIRLFWDFLRADNDTNPPTHLHPQDDPVNAEIFQEIRIEFQKKDKKLKEIMKTGNCLLKKFQRNQGRQECRKQMELVVAQVELKLVSRVLSMTKVTAEQLIWCHEKLGKVRLCNRTVTIEPSFVLFPC
ncbi:hypothetical protein LINGRAHAP2_LOCUS18580 [Linum grandiflorum]